MFSVRFLLGFISGLLTMLLFFVVLRASRPDLDADAMDTLVIALKENVLSVHRDHAGTIFVKGEPNLFWVEKFSAHYPDITFAPWSQRPVDLGCVPVDPAALIIGPCERNDFIGVSISFPLWRTAEAGSWAYNSGRHLTMIRVWKDWRITSDRWWVM